MNATTRQLLARWRSNPRPSTTYALCTALAELGEELRRDALDHADDWSLLLKVVDEVGEQVQQSHGDDEDVLLAAGRMHLAVGAVMAAQGLLLSAAKLAPNEPLVYLLLGEVLIRRGDAVRALKAFDRARRYGVKDPKVAAWIERATFYSEMQAARGSDAVRSEIRSLLGYPSGAQSAERPSEPTKPSRTRPGTIPPDLLTSMAPPPSHAGPQPVHKRTLQGMQAVTPAMIEQARQALGPAADKPLATDEDDTTEVAEPRTRRAAKRAELLARLTAQPEASRLPAGVPGPDELHDSEPPEGPTEKRPLAKARIVAAALEPDEEEDPTEVREITIPPSVSPRRSGSDKPRGIETRVDGVALRAFASADREGERAPSSRADPDGVPSAEKFPSLIPLTEDSAVASMETRLKRAEKAERRRREETVAAGGSGSRAAEAEAPEPETRVERLVAPKPAAAPQTSGPSEPAVHVGAAGDREARVRVSTSPPPMGQPPTASPTSPPPPGQPSSPPTGLAPAHVVPTRRKSSRRRWLVGGLAALGVGAAAATAVYWSPRATETGDAEKLASEALRALHEATPDTLAEAEAILLRAEAESSTHPSVVKARMSYEAMALLMVAATEDRAIELTAMARELGAEGPAVAIAMLASAVAIANRPLAEKLVAQYDESAADDPIYAWVAGLALELAGQGDALARYRAASASDLVVAHAEIARVQALAGEPSDASEALAREAMPAIASVLDVVRALRQGADLEPGMTVSEPDAVPQSYMALALASSAAVSQDPPGRERFERAIEAAGSPDSAVFCGEVALARGEVELARAAGKKALSLAPLHGAAAALSARLALAAGDLEAAFALVPVLPETEAARIQAISAYEMTQLDELERLSQQRPNRFVELARLRLRGESGVEPKELAGAAEAEPVWTEYLTVDLALDRGDLKTARVQIDTWGAEAAKHPVRSLRVARLLRYTEDFEAAAAAAAAALTTRAALSERVLIAASVKDARKDALESLDERLGPDLPWLKALLRARLGRYDQARVGLAEVSLPKRGDDLGERRVAALALAAVGDRRRGQRAIADLLALYKKQPEAIEAATRLGLLPAGAWPLRV